MSAATQTFKLAVICGGPSQERGISLNSARSVMDHLKSSSIDILPLYVDQSKNFYLISPAQLYSNTPADFDFKLQSTASKLEADALQAFFKKIDLVFPLIHGFFGEDGQLQALLEKYQVPFIGHTHHCCQAMFPKHFINNCLSSNGYATLPQLVIHRDQLEKKQLIEQFFRQYQLKQAIVKPTIGGSSIGVYSAKDPQETEKCLQEIFAKKLDDHALIEPFCEGKEFTVVVFENLKGEPVALLPTEVEIHDEKHQIFDFRKKYLPTNQTTYHTPPNFSKSIVEAICLQAEQMFKLFGMRDFVRLDGWITQDSTIYFTDINPLSGLEQNSFFFRQASLMGLTHRQALEYIVKNACQRYGLNFPFFNQECDSEKNKQPVYVLFGSHNVERQVSLMSGTNVWLKLLQSQTYAPHPFLYDFEENIWSLPYAYTLNHTVEEIHANCLAAQKLQNSWQDVVESICHRLEIPFQLPSIPQKMTLQTFLQKAKEQNAFVFIAMHGGDGENGILQKHLEDFQIPFNGSHSTASARCMDKYLTGVIIQQLDDPDILTVPKKKVYLDTFEQMHSQEIKRFWQECCHELKSQRLIIKPCCDGCSAGIVLLQSAQDLERYCCLLQQKASFIPPFSFANQNLPIEMPSLLARDYLLETYIETDTIIIQQNQMIHLPKEGWLELTVGVLEQEGHYHALNPSITIAEGAILSLEEKFQGGTGINLTPPPIEILNLTATQKIKHLIEKTAQALEIQNYARLDIFFNRISEKMILIEANTLPGLTPSTVIYHQGLAEEPSLTPLDLLNKIISSKLSAYSLISSSD